MADPRHDMRTDGDCFRCCVATVLGLEYEEVPAFNEPDEDQWVGNLSRWCRDRGFSMLMVMPHEGTVWSHFLSHGLWIAGGPGPRGIDHAVVYEGSDLLHDPHESREGLLRITEATVLFRPLSAREGDHGDPSPRGAKGAQAGNLVLPLR